MFYVNPSVITSGTGSVTSPFKWLNSRSWEAGDTIVIMNGDFRGATSVAQRRIDGAHGSATNWIRIVPYSAIDEENGDAAKETFRSVVELDGPWTDETSARSGVHTGMPGVWSMLLPNIQRLLGHVREVSSGLELYPHNTFSRAVSTGEPGIEEGWASVAEDTFPDFQPNGPCGFFVDLEHSETVSSQIYWRLYVRTFDGEEPAEGQFIGGYWTGPTIRNSSYVSIEDCAFDGLQNITISPSNGSYAAGAVNKAGGNAGIIIQATDGNACHHIHVRRCEFTCTRVLLLASAVSPVSLVHDVLVDECDFRRDGPTEYLYDQRAYAESDPYDPLYGFDPLKASIWDGHSQALSANHGGKSVVIRNCTTHAYSIYAQPSSSSTASLVESGKHLDIYGCVSTGMHDGLAKWSDTAGGASTINAAIWGCVLDQGTGPVFLSPLNGGPIWVFACRGDGFLHIPYKLGIQSTAAGYTTADGHGFKIIANTSFAGVGFTNSQSLGNQRFQGCYSGLLGHNNVVKGYQSTTGSPWFSYSDAFTGGSVVEPDRINLWKNGLIYIVNKSGASGDAARPKLYWDSSSFDPMHPTTPTMPPSAEIVWEDYIFDWSAREGSVDPFPTGAAAGLNEAITRTSVYVRGITDLAGDEQGDPVALEDLLIGCFPLRTAE